MISETKRLEIEERAREILEHSGLNAVPVESIVNTINRLLMINIDDIFVYKSIKDVNSMCAQLNEIKKRSTEAFNQFISYSTKTLCHSMGNPLRKAEDIIEVNQSNKAINSLLRVVTLLSYQFAEAASNASLFGDCRYSESSSSFVFDEGEPLPSYRKEIAHMARYFRLHLGSYLVIEFANQLAGKEKTNIHSINAFESVIRLYETGCADYIFNFITDLKKRDERLVTPILIHFDDNTYGLKRKVLGIHIYGDEEIKLWKKWGDPYDRLANINCNSAGNLSMEITPFSDSVAII